MEIIDAPAVDFFGGVVLGNLLTALSVSSSLRMGTIVLA
jgi:hypothetical protein